MSIPVATYKIHFQPTTGNDLCDAVRQLTDEGYQCLQYGRDDRTLLQVGHNSKYPYEDLVVLVEDEDGLIDPDRKYVAAVVQSCEWGGSKYAVGFENESIINSVRSFSQALEKKLGKAEC
jgi:hypothetical protein